MAHADGELPDADRRRVDTYLAQSPDAVRRYKIFATTRDDLRRLLNAPMTEPVPQRILETVLGSAAESGPQMARVLPWRQPKSVQQFRRGVAAYLPSRSMTSLAATLLIGAASGWALHAAQSRAVLSQQIVRVSGANMLASGALLRVLDDAPSGTTHAAHSSVGRVAITPVMTFRQRGGEPCRQYKLETASGQRSGGVACRNSRGEWQLETQTALGGAPPPSGAVVPSAAESSPVIEAAVDRMISGEAFGRADELALIMNRWRTALK
jgi:surface antigen